MSNPYRLLGTTLGILGAVFAPVFYFIINSVPLTALALSAVILGLTAIFLANARPYISPEACRMLLRTGMENTSSLLEELGVRNRAVYLPSVFRDGHPQALIPLTGEIDVERIREKLPGRLIVRYGPEPEEMALAVTTVGGINVDMLETKPGPTAEEMESALNYLLCGVLDIATGVGIYMEDRFITVTVKKTRLEFDDTWYYHSLGSPVAAIAASVCCEALEKPVRIEEEKKVRRDSVIKLEVMTQPADKTES